MTLHILLVLMSVLDTSFTRNIFADQTPEIDIDIDSLIDIVVTSFWDVIDQVVDSLAEVVWSFVPDSSSSIFTSGTLPLIFIILMILPVKIMLDRVRNAT